MSEQTYKKVFQLIQESLVPKTQLEENQKKILHLESMLEKKNAEIEKLKPESSEQKLSLEITQAEKESLQAEKKAIEVKFNEVSLKLQQETHQYNSLLRSQGSYEQALMLPKTANSPAASTGTSDDYAYRKFLKSHRIKHQHLNSNTYSIHITQQCVKAPEIFKLTVLVSNSLLFTCKDDISLSI